MNLATPDSERSRATRKERRQAPAPLSQLVRQALDDYFEQLDGAEPSDLYHLVMAQAEQPLLERVMRHTGGNQTRAAALLGISRATLRKKLALYNIE
ncbi:MAG TPA: DNA-binding transcriptional regulator Fis [Gammaproteobacteria bacterium]|nr:DNA-binding transcriptional regulator Fis [Gammaproteobacteria bacterium]